MGLGKILVRLAALTTLLFGFMWAIPQLAPQVPEPYEGVRALPPVSPKPTGSTTVPPPLPPGFPSMERPPPQIEVPDGQPQPIATKFGWTYDIPADWENWNDGFSEWVGEDGSTATYGAMGLHGRFDCEGGEFESSAISGMTGRRAGDLTVLAYREVQKASMIFTNEDGSLEPTVRIGDPKYLQIDGAPAVHYTALVEDIPDSPYCPPPRATFDVVTTTGFATAEVAVFVVLADRDVENALTDEDVEGLISSLRKSSTE
ncbi:hypothetical protein HQP42_10865 [Rhodococcus fascians]|nr:hypothetical protein [Rhodococcus fascians]MBY3825129.1 hypothetical protein [Rhodococcus fascians]MBY3835590.1 hypothetical protein [Rhodococcus fascians]MBY3864802.1 hypothetical protein [Rhodococcus fascians]MBY3884796.1 hypothetical protein [Rhodococcus fascians]